MTKHIDLDRHFIREKMQESLISLSHVSTHDKLAGVFTKVLSGPKHQEVVWKLGLFSPPPS